MQRLQMISVNDSFISLIQMNQIENDIIHLTHRPVESVNDSFISFIHLTHSNWKWILWSWIAGPANHPTNRINDSFNRVNISPEIPIWWFVILSQRRREWVTSHNISNRCHQCSSSFTRQCWSNAANAHPRRIWSNKKHEQAFLKRQGGTWSNTRMWNRL